MKNCLIVLGATVLTAWTAVAADVPKYETYVGYTYVRFFNNVPAGDFSANGGTGQFVYNFNRWIGGVVDAGAVTRPNVGAANFEGTWTNFVAGPRLYIRKWNRFTPFVEAFAGGVNSAVSVPFNPIVSYLPPGTIVLPPGTPGAPQGGAIVPPGSVFPPTTPGALPPGTVVVPGGTTVLPPGAPPFFPGGAFVIPPGTTAPGIPAGAPISGRNRLNTTGFAFLTGVGMDVKISRRVAFRPFEVDYYLTRIGNLGCGAFGFGCPGGNKVWSNIRATAGFNFMFGIEKPAPPPPPPPPPPAKVTISMTLTSPSIGICEGDTTQVTATVPPGANGLNYSWSVNGQPIAQGATPTFTFNSAGRQPGTYTVAAVASGAPFNPATAQILITVIDSTPPAGTVEATPSTLRPGDQATLTANFNSPIPMQQPVFEASEGTINGNQLDTSSIQWDATDDGEQRKTITITAKAANACATGTATTTIEVVKAAAPAAIRLPDVLFSKNSARVNNCGKRILLEQLRSYYERDSTGTVVLMGQASTDEKNPDQLAMQRAQNAAAVITAGTGVCLSIPQSQVQVAATGTDQSGVPFESGFCRSSVPGGPASQVDMRRVAVWFVPTGGKLPEQVTSSQPATALPISGLGCPK